MSRTVDNLLTLARVDEGRLELLTTRVDLLEAIEAAADRFAPLAAAKHLRLEVDGDACEAEADPQRLHQALTNFIENAIKYAQPGGEVRVTAWCADDEVGVTVTDNGPGIPRGGARAHLRPLLPRRPRPRARRRRQRARPRDLPRDRERPRRARLGRERGGQGQRVLAGAAARPPV